MVQSKAATPEAYLAELPPEKAEPMQRLHDTILEHLPEGFEPVMSYGMIGYVVPHALYPDGYHCKPEEPLPFMGLAAQSRHIGLYHMGIYADDDLLAWFQGEYAKQVPTKLDMGKSCIRFKNPKNIPYELVAELTRKMTPQDWIAKYESAVKR